MDISSLLWLAWFLLTAGSFAVLEARGLKSPRDRWYTLTNRVRFLMRLHPAVRAVLAGLIGTGLLWLFQHFLLIDPAARPGA